MKYLAFIGDLRGSREIQGRAGAQRDISDALGTTGKLYKGIFISPLTLTLGDEFQALMKPAADVPRLLDELELRLKGYPFRAGLGYGDILTDINPDLSIGADGPAYWNAREAINWVHDNSAGGKFSTAIRGFGGLRDDMLNSLFQSADAIKSKWTALQRETFDRMLREGIYQDKYAHNATARKMGISPSSLTKRVDAGNIRVYMNNRGVIGKAIMEWGHDAE